MKKLSFLFMCFLLFKSNADAYYYVNEINSSIYKTKNYNVNFNLNGGIINNDLIIKSDKYILPSITRNGYSFAGWSGSGDNYIANWRDDIPPTITRFDIEVLGFYNESLGYSAGVNLNIYVEGYDLGSGINKYQTVLLPYNKGSGGTRKDGSFRYMTNVLYLDEPIGRTFCAYIIDNAGNEAQMCKNVKI